MKKVLSFLLAGAMTASLAACGGPAASSTPAGSSGSAGLYDNLDPVELILADSAAPGAAGSTFDTLFADKVAEITGGKLTVDAHINGDLGNDTDLLRQMQSGDIDIVGSQIAPLVNFAPELAIFDLPMVFATMDGDTIHQVLNGDSRTHSALEAAFEKADWHLLGFLQNATFRLTTSNSNLETLDDFKGLQIRTMENKNHMDFWSAIGAAPTPLAWGEVYFALQSGAIEAEENAADTVIGANLQEVQKYLACTNHILYVNQLSMNKASWDALAPEYQAALEQAVAEAIDEMRTELIAIDTEKKAALQEAGMTLIEYDDSFFDEILALPSVQSLYDQIDEATNGLAKTLQDELNG
ncbi:MAG: TRAP transporter substrate-binding protein [Lawsonibacter sp.]|nr:TRAP transporter substrate-binding protein [Lawsonibacter sp.]